MASMKYRNDINGLRAIAVIAVVLFHFKPELSPGGYAGVDVFFVISGFLMTGIIIRGLENHSFDIWQFYISRAKRIIPALSVLCLALIIWGWFYFTTEEYRELGKHTLSSLLFFSNITYWNESGYFDATSHEKWLLHTWSLSVEWQFYIIYPILLVAIRHFTSLKNLKKIIVTCTFLGLFFSIFATLKWPIPSYYFLPTRGWELLVGGVAYLYPCHLSQRKKIALQRLGLILILISYVCLSSKTLWPGYWALLPVIGAYLIILTNQNDSIITNNKLFQIIGKWSYSIYLWHWPITVWIYQLEENFFVYGILISIILGALSYYLIENSNIIRFKLNQFYHLSLFIFLSLFSGFIFYDNGIKSSLRSASLSPKSALIEKYQHYLMDPSGLWQACNATAQISKTGQPTVDEICIANHRNGIFLWGDSHIGALSVGIRNVLPTSIPISQLASPGCMPSLTHKKKGLDSSSIGCNYSNSLALEVIKKAHPAVVILGMRRNHENNDWINTVNRIISLGVQKVIIIGPVPQWQPSLPIVYAKRHMGETYIHDNNFDYSLIKSNNYLTRLAQNNTNFSFVNIIDYLCAGDNDNFSCKVVVPPNDLLVFDYGHLTLAGSVFITKKLLLDEITPFLPSQPQKVGSSQ